MNLLYSIGDFAVRYYYFIVIGVGLYVAFKNPNDQVR